MNKQIEIEDCLNKKMAVVYKAPLTRQMSPMKSERKAKTPSRRTKKLTDSDDELEEIEPPSLPIKVIK